MAKKGGVQQLQADINTDEEFEKFLERPGLLVLDVYSEWCGPSLGMVGSLKKIKLELGGDNLNLAICKADAIQALERFRNKSEPTWLFVTNGKACNLMFGTNVPKLMQMIASELNNLNNQPPNKKYYEIVEMQPEELVRFDIIQKATELAKKIEAEAAEQKRKDYLTFVTDTIMSHLPDMGITLFGPQVNRDIFKRLMEPADNLHISCKDRKVIQIAPEHIEILHFSCNNPIDPEVLQQLYNKDLLICFWKIADDETRSVEEVLNIYCRELTKPQTVVDEYGNINPDIQLPSIISPIEVKIKVQIVVTPPKSESIENKAEKAGHTLEDNKNDLMAGIMDNMPGVDDALDEEKNKTDATTRSDEVTKDLNREPKTEEAIKIITVPAVWTPGNRQTTAAVIYVFFRPQTTPFLPPDPPPEPPHLIVIFDAYKRKDITNVFEKFKHEIMLYGYFSNQDPETATLMANSTKNYEKNPPVVTDKLVVKVSKQTSDALLALAAQGPCYVSPNTVVGKKEALQFFPNGYKTGEMEELENAAAAEKKKEKKKKKKKGADIQSDTTVSEVGAAGEDGEPTEGGEEMEEEDEEDQDEASPENSPTGE